MDNLKKAGFLARTRWIIDLFFLFFVGFFLSIWLSPAQAMTETLDIEGGRVEINRQNNIIINIRETRKESEDNLVTENETIYDYDKQGKCKGISYSKREFFTDSTGKQRLKWDFKTSIKFDSQGRITSLQKRSASHGFDKDKVWTKQSDTTEDFTVYYRNGERSVEGFRRNELTGEKEKLDKISNESAYRETARPVQEHYKEVLKQAEAWSLKKLLGRKGEIESLTPLQPARGPEYGTSVAGLMPVTTISKPLPPPDPSFYMGLFGGPALTGVNGLDADYSDFNAFVTLLGKKNLPCTSATVMSGGARFGTWGNWGVAPEWTKYFGVSLDFSYQKLPINTGMGTYTQTFLPFGVTQTGNVNFASNGSLATLGFMFNARYGFFPDQNISTLGTLQPFLGVGPVLGFASVEPSVYVDGNFVRQFGSQSSVFLGFGLEAGARYFPHRNIYLEASYRFFYGQPGFDGFKQQNFTYNFNPDITTHNFRFGIGAAF